MIVRAILFSILSLVGYSSFAQTAKDSKSGDNNTEIYRFVDMQAHPRKGLPQFLSYLSHTIHYPKQAKEAGIEGKVTYQFVVNKDGHISNVRILRDIGGGCGDAVKEAITAFHEAWIPASNDGHPVNCYYTGTFNFDLQ